MVEIKPFNCSDLDKNVVRVEWEKWLRSLKLYFESEDIFEGKKRKAKLLHLGGPQLQEVIFTLPGALEEPPAPAKPGQKTTDSFEWLVEKLNDYFSPQRNSTFERNLFRDLKPVEGEESSKFLMKLRTQANRCEFGKTETESRELAIKDKLIGDWAPPDLRKRLLEKELSTEQIINMCAVYEQVNKQLIAETPGTSDSINRVSYGRNKSDNRYSYNRNEDKSSAGNDSCYRCGKKGHRANDKKCPALNSKCNICSRIGHYAKMCRTKFDNPRKRPREEDRYEGNQRKKLKNENVYRVDEVSEQEDYACNNISSDEEIINNNETISCLVGGVKVNLLIDSGCKYNLLSEEDWNSLKNNKAVVFNERYDAKNTFRAYAADGPLKIMAVFESPVKILERQEKIETFYVVKKGRDSLLGRDSALKLKVLKLGISVNEVTSNVLFPAINGIKIKLSIDKSVEPVRQPVRRVPVGYEKEVEKKILENLAQGIIEKVEGFSLWLSPIVIVTKDDGTIRICSDLRLANLAIRRELFPFPTVDEIFAKLSGMRFFSRLDLSQAYYQLELEESSRFITRFITHIGIFQYTRLCFGINAAPEIFQSNFQSMLAPLSGCLNYLDDTIVFGRDEEEHDRNLKAVLELFKLRNVTINEKKCIYRATQLKFLGHIISDSGIIPDPAKVETIVNFRAPNTKEELRSFLGLVSYLGKFVPDLATVSAPLWKLIKAEEPFDWRVEQNEAFHKLKLSIGDVSKLSYFDLHLPTRLIVDASPIGLGAVLLQFKNHNIKIIGFASRSLTDVEKRYSQTEKEGLACVWGVERFYYYLAGVEFELQTDHKPLTYMFNQSSRPPARVERWVLRLQLFKFKIVYKAGKQNIADSLSRLCQIQKTGDTATDMDVYAIVEGSVPKALTISEISIESEKDKEFEEVRLGIITNHWQNNKSPYFVFRFELSTLGNIILRGDRLIIPANLRKRVLQLAHEGHPGESVMKRRLRSKVWWPLIDREAEKFVKSCQSCLMVSRPDRPPPMQRHTFPEKPWTYLAIDLLGPVPNTGDEYLVVLIDYYSRFVELEFIKPISSSAIISFLDDTFSRQGFPMGLKSDNGRQFVSKLTKEYCEYNNIELTTSPPLWPQANGLVENMNGQLDKRLKIAMANKLDYKSEINKFILMYNVTPHGTTEAAPSELLYKRKIRDKIPSISDVTFDSEDNVFRDMDMINKQKGKEREDRRRGAKETQIKVGDLVLMKNTEIKNKLTPNFGSIKYTVMELNNNEALIKGEGKQYRRHLSHLKKIPQINESSIEAPTSRNSIDLESVQEQHPHTETDSDRHHQEHREDNTENGSEQQQKVEPLQLKRRGGMWQPVTRQL